MPFVIEETILLKINAFSSMSASDISDTDFACQSEGEKESHSTSEEAEEEDLEKLERARAELQVELFKVLKTPLFNTI